MSDFATLPLNSLIINQYHILEVSSENPHRPARIYIVNDTQNNDAVRSIKEIDLCYLNNVNVDFLTEARRLMSLNDPSLPKTHNYFLDDNRAYLVMEHISVSETHPLDLIQWMECFFELCDTLTYLHNQTPPFIYGHLEIDNVLLDTSGKSYLTQSSITRHMCSVFISADYDYRCHNGRKGVGFPGINAYEAPETIRDRNFTILSDIFSFGGILWSFVTKIDPKVNWPFLSQDLNFKGHKVSPSTQLEAVISKAVKWEPGERWQSVIDLKVALEQTPEYAEYIQK